MLPPPYEGERARRQLYSRWRIQPLRCCGPATARETMIRNDCTDSTCASKSCVLCSLVWCIQWVENYEITTTEQQEGTEEILPVQRTNGMYLPNEGRARLLVDETRTVFRRWLYEEPALMLRSVSAPGGFTEDSADKHLPEIDKTKISTRR